MSGNALNPQDEMELNKFIKYFVLKAVQIIVQSRLGEKINTKSKPHSSGLNWFNLAITDHPDITLVTKKALGDQLPSCDAPLCIEISMKTIEGLCMTLESWCIQIDDKCDFTVRIAYTVYNRMELLLKSLIAVTRVTPCYKLSRRQSGDSYVICYRVYMGQPQLQILGDDPKYSMVGQLTTPGGTISVSVSYRTDLTFSPQQLNRGTGIMVKSDHFTQEKKFLSKDYASSGNLMAAPPVSKLECTGSPITLIKKTTPKKEDTSRRTVSAFADYKPISDSPELRSLTSEYGLDHLINLNLNEENKSTDTRVDEPCAEKEKDVETVDNIPDSDVVNNKVNKKNDEKVDSVETTDGDFVLIQLKTPFSCSSTNSEIGAFLRTCRAAPSLASFEEAPTLIDEVQLFNDQLTSFESCKMEFDELVQSLCEGEEVK